MSQHEHRDASLRFVDQDRRSTIITNKSEALHAACKLSIEVHASRTLDAEDRGQDSQLDGCRPTLSLY